MQESIMIYNDPKPCVSVIPVKDNKILIAVRGKEPYKSEYDLIGGFMEIEESAEEAGKREMKEETGLNINIVKYLGSYPDTYGNKDNFTIGLTYIVEIIGGEMKAMDDVSELKWIEIKDIPNLKLNGFKNTKLALQDLYKLYF